MQESIDQSAQTPESGAAAGSGGGDAATIALEWLQQSWIMLALAALFGFFIVVARWHRLKLIPRRPKIFTPEVGLTLLFAMFLLGIIGGEAATRLLHLDPEAKDLATLAKRLIGVYAGQAIVVGLYVSLLSQGRRPTIDDRRSRGEAVLVGLVALGVCWPIVMSVGNVAGLAGQLIWGHPPEAVGHETLARFLEADRDVWFWLMAVLVTVFPGVMEEVMYRGLGQELLGRLPLGRWTVVILVSVVFALMHAGIARPYALVALFVLSLGFGWAYEKTGRLAAPIAMHIGFNAANLTLALWTQGA